MLLDNNPMVQDEYPMLLSGMIMSQSRQPLFRPLRSTTCACITSLSLAPRISADYRLSESASHHSYGAVVRKTSHAHRPTCA
jgi:hypothetical protein